MTLPNFQPAANDGLITVNDSAPAADVQWSARQLSSLSWIFPQPENAQSQKMSELSRQQVTDMLSASEAKVEARLANFDTSIKTGFADLATAMAKHAAAMEKQTDSLRLEMAKQSGDLRTEMANGRADATKQNSDSTRWIVLAVFTMLSISVAIIGVMINFNKGDKGGGQSAVQQAQSAVQQGPVIVAVPAGSVLLSAPQASSNAPAQAAK